MTPIEGTPDPTKHNPVSLQWVSAATTLLALGATCAMALTGYPTVAVAVAALGTASSVSVTVIISYRSRH